MKKIIVASKSPVKINAAMDGFIRMFPDETFEVEGVSVPSGVANQPMSDAETFQGALNRSQNAHRAIPEADFWVGIEGGVEIKNNEMETFAWIVITGNNNLLGKARTGTFFLPPKIKELIEQGKELGEADDIVFNLKNSKMENGAVGILSSNAIHRAAFYSHAVVLALIPFRNPDLYE